MTVLRQHRAKVQHPLFAGNQQRRKIFDIQIAHGVSLVFNIQPAEKHMRERLAYLGKHRLILAACPAPFRTQANHPELRIHLRRCPWRRKPILTRRLIFFYLIAQAIFHNFSSIDPSDTGSQRPAASSSAVTRAPSPIAPAKDHDDRYLNSLLRQSYCVCTNVDR